jgi:hypothetical protein
LFAQGVVDPGEGAVVRPFVEVIADTVLVREVLRQVFPRATGAIQVADRVQDLADVEFSRSSRPRRGANVRSDQFPFGIGEVRGVSPLNTASDHAILKQIDGRMTHISASLLEDRLIREPSLARATDHELSRILPSALLEDV